MSLVRTQYFYGASNEGLYFCVSHIVQMLETTEDIAKANDVELLIVVSTKLLVAMITTLLVMVKQLEIVHY